MSPTHHSPTASPRDPLQELLACRLLICLGPGGVGKTTASAAFALAAGLGGWQVDVMTVDPAPRLLDALGLDSAVATTPHEVNLEKLAVFANLREPADTRGGSAGAAGTDGAREHDRQGSGGAR